MTESQVREEYLDVYTKPWRRHDALGRLSLLAKHAESAKATTLRVIVDAHLDARQNRAKEAVERVEAIAVSDGSYSIAQLLLGRVLCNELGKHDSALEAFDRVLALPPDTNPSGRLVAGLALWGKSVALGNLNRPDAAIAICDKIASEFHEETLPVFIALTAMAMVNKTYYLDNRTQTAAAIASCDAVVERYGASDEPDVRVQVVTAIVNKGIVFREAQALDDAISTFDLAVVRFGEDTDLGVREQVAKALHLKGMCLAKQERTDDELTVCGEIVKRFPNETEGLIGAIVGRATEFVTAHSAVPTPDDKPKPQTQALPPAPREGVEFGRLQGRLEVVLRSLPKADRDQYFRRMEDSKARTKRFLSDDSHFADDRSFLLVLREWNSYTPVIPTEGESDRGGGYYLRHAGEGIVIDPGYDFIANFHNAGGRLCDIDHIILTHAHDDHTAEFEALLMLLHQCNKDRKHRNPPLDPKRVSLYLSTGAQRKFSGLIDLRDRRFRRIITLCSGPNCDQSVDVAQGLCLTVLPAYHDDVTTRDTAVGLGFEVKAGGKSRRILFTSDTGLYPRFENEQGDPLYYDVAKERPKLDTSAGKALHEAYPTNFMRPDLMVIHIGSIQKSEFEPPEAGRDPGEWYYANHLGALGTLTMLQQVRPAIAVVSEFGAELKGFHIELVDRITRALLGLQTADGVEEPDRTLVIPGDPLFAYDIVDHRVLCHENCCFEDPARLSCRPGPGYIREWDTRAGVSYVGSTEENSSGRAYLFLREQESGATGLDPARSEEAYFAQRTRKYFEALCDETLPYHRNIAR